MPDPVFPLQNAALHPDWPEARFNVSGMFVFDMLIMQFMEMAQAAFGCRVPIDSLHGAPALPWNAGRPAKAPFNSDALVRTLDALHLKNVGYFPTFSNHLLDDQDLANPIGNAILEAINRRPDLNGVIVASDRLSAYIARKYPNLRQVASIIKVTFDNGRGRADYYRQLGQRFYRYVVHPDDCRNLALLDQLDRDKAEIIVNENCGADCPNRPRHYTAYARFQKALGTAEQERINEELKQIIAICPSPFHIHRLGERRRSCNLNRSEIKAIYDMGFRHFKIQGRGDDPFSFSFDLTRFMLEPEFAAPHLYKAISRNLRKV